MLPTWSKSSSSSNTLPYSKSRNTFPPSQWYEMIPQERQNNIVISQLIKTLVQSNATKTHFLLMSPNHPTTRTVVEKLQPQRDISYRHIIVKLLDIQQSCIMESTPLINLTQPPRKTIPSTAVVDGRGAIPARTTETETWTEKLERGASTSRDSGSKHEFNLYHRNCTDILILLCRFYLGLGNQYKSIGTTSQKPKVDQ